MILVGDEEGIHFCDRLIDWKRGEFVHPQGRNTTQKWGYKIVRWITHLNTYFRAQN